MTIETKQLKKVLEAALLSAGKTLSTEQLLQLFTDDERPSAGTLKEVLVELQSDYADRGIELKEVASGYRFQARQETAEWVARLYEEKPPKYSRAFLETLALIAYRQPVTRAEIEDVRGVSVSSNIIKAMLEREWIRVVGHRDVPGRPALYATTKQFLDYFNMKSLEELPSLAEIKDLEDLNPELALPDPDQVEDSSEESTVSKEHSGETTADSFNDEHAMNSEEPQSAADSVETEETHDAVLSDEDSEAASDATFELVDEGETELAEASLCEETASEPPYENAENEQDAAEKNSFEIVSPEKEPSEDDGI